jgi:uncharacterized membrane protein YphA (DoxX/SURF4 family)
MNIKWIGFLRIVVGVFILAHGINIIDWFRSSEFLRADLQAFAANPHPATQWVLKHAALPYADIWALVIPAGEILIGALLIAGVLSRTAFIISIAMLLLYHIADGRIFSPLFITDPNCMLLLAAIVTLTFLRSGSVFAVRKSRR